MAVQAVEIDADHAFSSSVRPEEPLSLSKWRLEGHCRHADVLRDGSSTSLSPSSGQTGFGSKPISPLEMVGDQAVEQAHAIAGRALGIGRPVLVVPDRKSTRLNSSH